MSAHAKSHVSGYGCAVVSIALAIGTRRLLDPVLGTEATLFLAVVVTAWYGGVGPALAAVALGFVWSSFFLIPGGISGLTLRHQAGLALYALTGTAISLLAGSMHAARRRAESTARSERRQAALIDQTYDPVFVWEWRGPIVSWNRGAERLYGFPPEEAVGRVSDDLLHTRPEEAEAFAGALDREGSWEGELHHAARDGHAIIVESRMVLVRDDDGAYVLETNRDVTARKKAENALQDANDLLETRVRLRTAELADSADRLQVSEERTRLILEGVRSHAIFMLDAAGNIASWNRGAEQVKEYKAEEVIGRHFSLFYTPEDIERGTPQRELQTAATNGYLEAEGLRVRKDGSRFWALVTISPLFGKEAQPIGFVEVARDITQRKKTEQALRTSEERFHLLVDGVADHAILMLDPAGTILTWNSGAERMDGYTADEIVGRHYSCLFTPESIADGEPKRDLEQAAKEGKVDIEGWRIRKNGARFWVNGTLSALHDDDGKVQGFAKITRDSTAKRRNDELLRAVLDNTLDGIILIDVWGTVSMINRAGESVFGYSGAEVVGRNVNMLMPQPYHREHDAYLANYMRTGEAKVIGIGREVRGLRKNGFTFPVDLAVTEFRLDSDRYFVGIVRDISEKKKLESQFHQAQKMEAFGQLAGGVAHDFNNLLTVISGYGDMLFTALPPNDPRARMADGIRRAGERAAALTRQLLAFSRQQVLEPKVLDLNVVITDIGRMLRRLIGEDVQFTTVLRPAVSSVRVDPGQIEQVIMNLAVNARDAMAQGGKLTIETGEVDLDDSYTRMHPEVRPGRFVAMTVSDTGCGMSPEVQARIFEPFFTTKGVGKGTGLGLAVVHGIVKQSGGGIEVYSEAGVGTTFKIYLPAVAEQPAALSSHGTDLPPRGAGTILLVEDDDSVRDFAALALEGFGYTILTAPGAEAALALMANHTGTVDLLVTDVVMPETGGCKLAETLQSLYPRLKVLFISGYTDDAVVRHGVLQADVAFLQKPFTPDSLARKVRKVLD